MLETNVHFPTDLNLALDASRKCLELCASYAQDYGFTGWRKAKDWVKKVKTKYLKLTRIKKGGGANKEERLEQGVEGYLTRLREVEQKTQESLIAFREKGYDLSRLLKIEKIQIFSGYLTKHIDLIERRLLEGEKIPHEEKMFSLFEPHTEWIAKGKARPNVELGHRLLITTNQHGMIVDSKVMEGTTDSEEVHDLIDRLKEQYGEGGVASHSFDKGFYSAENKKKVGELSNLVVMPKRGKLNKEELQEETDKIFKKFRNAHSAVESDINCLEHHGLDRCPDKGLKNYKRYVELGVMAYNLHKIGNKIQGIKRGKPKPKAKQVPSPRNQPVARAA